MGRRGNIVKFNKKIDFNIGYVVFIVIILYLAISVIIYAASDKVVIYEVNKGSLSLNNVYSGIIARDEQIVKSEYSGNINYYLDDKEKTDKVTVIYSVDETGHISELLSKYSEDSLPDRTVEDIKNLLSGYTSSYSENTYGNLYEVKNKIESKLNRSHYNIILKELDKLIEESGNTSLFHKVTAKNTGIVMFTTDGYEGINDEGIDKAYSEKESYTQTSLRDSEIINTGDLAYRLISSDTWYIYIKLNESDIAAFADKTSVNIRFSNDDIECQAGFEMIKSGGNTYGKLKLNKYMINFAEERYVDIEIVESSKTGLEIPITSVLKKNFYTIPLKFLTESNNFVRIYYKSNGEMETEPVNATIYDSDDKYYYVSMSDFSNGDIIADAETGEQYVIGTIGELPGVYCVNKGYTQFRKVDIIDRNNEYYIIKQGSAYGLKVYDHIVLDYSTVKEDELI